MWYIAKVISNERTFLSDNRGAFYKSRSINRPAKSNTETVKRDHDRDSRLAFKRIPYVPYYESTIGSIYVYYNSAIVFIYSYIHIAYDRK